MPHYEEDEHEHSSWSFCYILYVIAILLLIFSIILGIWSCVDNDDRRKKKHGGDGECEDRFRGGNNKNVWAGWLLLLSIAFFLWAIFQQKNEYTRLRMKKL